MPSRRSGPGRTHTRRVQIMEVVEADATQSSTAGAADDDVFFCVAATSRRSKSRISYFRTSAAGADAESSALALAALCLAHAPDHHRWHHHTVAGARTRRTFAFLAADDGRTYFAAADPTPGAAEVVRFLERVRDACDAAPRKRLRDEAVAPVAREFAATMLRRTAAGSGPGASSGVDDDAEAEVPGASLQAQEDEAEREKDEEEEEEHGRGGERRRRGVRPSGESARMGMVWRPWRRHAAAVVVVDVVLCLVLFAVWMGVCRGFRCLTR